MHAFAARFHEQYSAYALRTPLAWLDAVDGGAVRQASPAAPEMSLCPAPSVTTGS